jgi:hypothetical protein
VKAIKRTIATTEVLLILPSVLFMTALFVRNLQPLQYEPAHTAQQIVDWYAARPRVGLWLLLTALPLAVLVAPRCCATGTTTLICGGPRIRRLPRYARTSRRSSSPPRR